LSWQFTPCTPIAAISDTEPVAPKCVFDAVMATQKIDPAMIEAAWRVAQPPT
jgi:hypothetical protein